MAGIALRDYLQEVEKQIEGGRIDEAIAHCRYILENYPKNVAAYRLLGKAFLESQRFGDAGDIFQRVLSSIPDDFVSHVGMSLIREDEGNLDEAIWHMQRAFDVQPSNGAIQEELRRLYGKRDHMEPPKIRLTRGALTRMYAKGELYVQAIAEARAALLETPDRLDLQTLLAEVYFQAGQKAEASEIARQILQRLPYCLSANRIIADALTNSNRSEEAHPYLQRLHQLEPYSAFISALAPTTESVPDSAIKLDKLDYKPSSSAAVPGQPSWASNLGAGLGEGLGLGSSAEKLPEWLSQLPPSSSGEQALSDQSINFSSSKSFIVEEPQTPASVIPEAASDDAEIPEWMKNMGWGSLTEEGRQAEASFHSDEAPIEDLPGGDSEAIASTEIPDWLQAIAPAVEADLDAPLEDEENLTPWLDKLFGDNAPPPAEMKATEDAGSGELPDWLRAADETPLEAETEAEADELPAWLSAADETAAAPEAEVEATLGELPDWLSAADDEAPTAAAPEAQVEAMLGELPDWLRAADETPLEAETGAEADELPAWLSAADETAAAPEAEVEAALGELPDWLSATDDEAPTAAAPEAEVEATLGELPDWLSAADDEAPTAAAPEAEVEATLGELPDWLRAADETALEAETGAEADELPHWLSAADETAAAPEAQVEATLGELPDWLSAADETALEAETGAEADELPHWLSAADETAAAPEAQVEATLGELPDWLSAADDEAPTAAAPEAQVEATLGEMPDWLRATDETPLEAETEAEADELPDWLRAADETAAAPEAEVEATLGELPDWLSAPDETAAAPEAQVEATLGELPDWLRAADDEAPTATAPEAEVEATLGELPDWLSAADETPLEAETEAEADELPHWLSAADDEAPTATASEAQVEATLGELPDWLSAADETPAPEAEVEATLGELPDWLSAVDETPLEAHTEGGELPEWLSAADQPGDTAPTRVPPVSEEAEEDLEDALAWLTGLMAAPAIHPDKPAAPPPAAPASGEAPAIDNPPIPPADPPTAAAAEPNADDDAFAWLESLAVKQGASEALLLKSEERSDTPPDWVQQAIEHPEPETPPVTAAVYDAPSIAPPVGEDAIQARHAEDLAEAPSTAAVEPVDAEESVAPASTPAEPPTAAAAEPNADDDAFAWLESLAVKQGASEALLLKSEERSDTPPDWVQQAIEHPEPETPSVTAAVYDAPPIAPPVGEDAIQARHAEDLAEAPSTAAVEPVDADESAAPASTPAEPPTAAAAEPNADDDAFAWLESLAVKQGANEALLLRPDERSDTPPEWVLQQSDDHLEGASNAEMQAPPDMARMVGSQDLRMLDESVEETAEPAASQPAQPADEGGIDEDIPAPASTPSIIQAHIDTEKEESAPPSIPTAAEPVQTEAPAPQPELSAPARKKLRDTGGLPPLPDWLSGSVNDAADAPEWTPPPVTKRKYDLNKISLGELERLPGVGFIMAQRIVLFREQNGPFWNVDDLLTVPDFSPLTLEDIRDNLFVLPSARPKTGPLTAEKPATPEPIIIRDDKSVPLPLALAREAFSRSEVTQALTHYAEMIQRNQLVNRVIEDLEIAARQYPDNVAVWQTLGDAHLRLNQPAEAMKAYIQAERLLR